MPRKLSEIAAQYGVTNAALRVVIAELGFELGKTASTLSDEIVAALQKKYASKGSEAPTVIAEKKPAETVAQKKDTVAQKVTDAAPVTTDSTTSDTAVAAAVDEPTVPAKPELALPETIVVKELASKVGRPVTELISVLVQNGIMATINAQLDFDTAAIIAEDLGFHAVPLVIDETADTSVGANLITLLSQDDPKRLVSRAPVVSVIGHVDHGKTKLLDRIRGTAVMETEAGGITQRIGAYQVKVNGKLITFLDTPGHEAFTAMRARGVKLTDIAILVVAADDGVMPQTIEAISHARDAGIPLVVAINKIDKPGADVDRVKKQLAEHDVLLEGWGGKIVSAEISALKGTGIEALLELLTIVADLEDLKADAGRPAVGTVIESHRDLKLGPIASVLIHTGTLRMRDSFVVGTASGRVRIMFNYKGEQTESVGPSEPVLIAGLSDVPQTGDILQVTATEREAKDRADKAREASAHSRRTARVTLHSITQQAASNQATELKLILKADTKGSLEAIRGGIAKIPSVLVTPRIVHADTGDVSNSDIMLAAVSGAVVFGFNVSIIPQVFKRAEFEGVDVRRYNVIYSLLEDVEKAMQGMLEPELERTDLGIAKVLKVFFTGKNEMVVGVNVDSGKVRSGCKIDVVRDQAQVGTGEVKALKLLNEDVFEIRQGTECGLRFGGTVRLRVGDELEVYSVEQKLRSLQG